jgi:hypothetical protein
LRQNLDGFVEEAFASTLRGLTVAGILFDIGDQAGIENALTIVRGIKAAIKVQVGTSEVQPDLLGHLLQGFQTLGQEHHIRFIDRRHRDRRSDRAIVVDDGDDFVTLLVFVP